MYLVYDINGVFTYLRRYTHLVYQRTDVFHRVVRRGVELVDVERPLLVEGSTRLALVARVVRGGWVQTVDGLGEDARTGRLTYTAGTAEQVRVR